MRKNKALFALLTGVLAAALFAVPATAMAETTTITQDSFADGVYTIEKPGDYALGGDVTGSIKFNPNAHFGTYSLDLDGHTLKNDSSSQAITCNNGKMNVQINVRNGKIVKSGNNTQAIRVDAPMATINLSDLDVTATDAIAIFAQNTTVNVTSGSYKTIDSATDEPVVCAANASGSGKVYISGGTFTLEGNASIVKVDDSTGSSLVSLSGGTFSSFPDAAVISDANSYSVHKTSKGFEVVSGINLPKDACWRLKYGDVWVYFDTTADKDEFVKDYTCTDIEQLRATVTFDPANGDDPVKRVVSINETASGQIEDPVKADGVFKFWSADGTTDFDIEHTKITKDTTLAAVYGDAVATNGEEGYASLQAAIDDNGHEASTIKLLKDTTESVTVPEGADLTIDLNGHTLTASGSKAALGLAGKANLVIESNAKGGKIVSSTTGIGISNDAAGSSVTLKGDITVQTTSVNAADAAVSVNGASALVIEDGVYSAKNDKGKSSNAFALIACGGATVSVTDGSFESDSDCTIKIADATTKADFACDISGHIDLDKTGAKDENVVIHAGTLGDATNAKNVESGKYLYKGNEEDAYKVISLTDDEYVYDAMYVVYNDGVTTKVYFKTEKAADAYAEALEDETGEDSYVINLYRATLVANGTTVDIRVREVGEELGELPDGSEYQIDDYTFAGWYVDGKKVDSSYEVLKDVDVVAMWYWNGSSNEDPTPNPSKKENKHLPQTGDPALAVSGIAAAGAALAGIGALRRRK